VGRLNPLIGKGLAAVLVVCLCARPPLLPAQSTPDSAAAPVPSGQQSPSVPADKPGIVDPARGPLQPVSPSPRTPDGQTSASTPPAPNPANQNERPAGAAVGQRAETVGGAASRPAGAAIAPAKQHQTRSLFIKIGALAAAGVAAGAVIALSRGTSSNPPGAK
jgi:hypothetical protein